MIFGDFGVFVALAIDDVAPVAPDGADIEEDGFVFGFGAGESGVTPFVPVDGLVRSGAQVGAGGVFQAGFQDGRSKSLTVLSWRTAVVEIPNFVNSFGAQKALLGCPPKGKRRAKVRPLRQRVKTKATESCRRAEVARVERFAAGEAFVLAMVKADAVLAKLPAEINVLLVDDGREIEEAHRRGP